VRFKGGEGGACNSDLLYRFVCARPYLLRELASASAGSVAKWTSSDVKSNERCRAVSLFFSRFSLLVSHLSSTAIRKDVAERALLCGRWIPPTTS
jgi:hypothetical protein